MRLAIACGRPDVDAMLESITSQEFDEWVAYYRLEPFGYQAMIDVVANAAAAVCHALGSKVMPWMITGAEEPQETVSPNQASAMIRKLHGNNR